MTHNNEKDAPRHRPECWCNGAGWRDDLGVRCNLPQLTDSAPMTHRLTWTPPGTRHPVHITSPTQQTAEYEAQRISAAFGGIEVAITPAEEHT